MKFSIEGNNVRIQLNLEKWSRTDKVMAVLGIICFVGYCVVHTLENI